MVPHAATVVEIAVDDPHHQTPPTWCPWWPLQQRQQPAVVPAAPAAGVLVQQLFWWSSTTQLPAGRAALSLYVQGALCEKRGNTAVCRRAGHEAGAVPSTGLLRGVQLLRWAAATAAAAVQPASALRLQRTSFCHHCCSVSSSHGATGSLCSVASLLAVDVGWL
jgi:hypothetical protein